MKINFIEICGFRGFRSMVRLDFGPGFTVLSGRNGVGKSTICDAIEFALTGAVSKYAYDKAARERFEDYIWWRGDVPANERYVLAGFKNDAGEQFSIRRTLEQGASHTPAEIEEIFCAASVKPPAALKQMVSTSIIRDEWIAASSLDLTEHERGALVQSAVGALGGRDYAAKAEEVIKAAKVAENSALQEHEAVRGKLAQALADLSQAKDFAARVGDVAAAMATVTKATGPEPSELFRQISAARSILAARRVRLDDVSRSLVAVRNLGDERRALASPEFVQRKADAALALQASQKTLSVAEERLAEANRRLDSEENVNQIATSLSAIIEHGSRLGLHDGTRCPLCNAERTSEEFAEALDLARARLVALGSQIDVARKQVNEARLTATAAAAAVKVAEARVLEFAQREATLSDRYSTLEAKLSEQGLDSALLRQAQSLETFVSTERSELVDLERSIVTLEASRAVERVTELELRVTSIRDDIDIASKRLARANAAATISRDIAHTVKRVRAEITDERLALMTPLLNEFYQRLRPHADWRSIEYRIRGDVTRLLSLKVGEDINPQFVFSSGQRRAAGLAFLLSVYMARPWCRWNTIVLDDPVQHIDDYRALHLVEVLAVLNETGIQVVVGVEDPALADLLCRRLTSAPQRMGYRYDLQPGSSPGEIRHSMTEIAAMPTGVLRSSSGLANTG